MEVTRTLKIGKDTGAGKTIREHRAGNLSGGHQDSEVNVGHV
jgi:hypothetical protein